MIELILQGMKTALSLNVFPFLLFGVTGGIAIGSLPGLTATMGVAVLLPLTFGMESTRALVLLVGVYIGAIYGGSISAILLKTPGTPAAAATVLDGHSMAKKGEAAKALSISAIASFVGGTVSTVMLILFSPILAKFALRFGAPEYFALAIFGLSIIASISGKHPAKGLLAGMLGLLVATVGLDPVTSYPRFTFGQMHLYNGFSIIPVLIGLFALSETFVQMETFIPGEKIKTTFKRGIISLKETISLLPVMLKSGFIGAIIGSIPGAGADIAAFVTYNEARRSSKEPERFGEGSPEGIAAPEAGNNGVTGGALVPLLTLGVPGDAVAAVMLGALIIQGLQPGPLLFTQNADVVYGLFASMLVGNLLMLILGLMGVRLFCRVVEIPKQVIIPTVITLSIVGAYSMNNSVFDLWVALGFGVIGYLMQKVEIPASPVILAVILGPMAESNLRRSVLMYQGGLEFLWTRPITVLFIVLAAISLVSSWIRARKEAH
nr:tripartite tricarboxylate transporter permease [uncultured Dethiosulfovibrio sp.]